MPRARPKVVRPSLAKAPTGIQGLDEVTGGGLPKGRVTLVCGSAGYGKSLLAMEFLVHGAVRYGEPGVCVDFEETEEKLRANVASLGFDLRALTKRKKLLVDYVSIERYQVAETGEYNHLVSRRSMLLFSLKSTGIPNSVSMKSKRWLTLKCELKMNAVGIFLWRSQSRR
jgi:KaiC/GvpD/RAD55 family RecA-like ATPase